MSTLFASNALLYAGECLLASVVLVACAFAATRVCRRAAMRHLIWSTAFGAMLVFPLAALIAPAQAIVLAQAPVAMAQAVPVPGAMIGMHPPAHAAPFAPNMQDIALGLLALWLAGVAFFASRFVAGALGLRALRRRSHAHRWPLDALPDANATRRECELRISATADGPLTWGVFRPVILLPCESASWPRERLHAVLLHELAHVRRRDSLTRLLALLACTLFWPNPLTWMAARRLRREAEIAVDDAVITSGVRPSAYASELLHLAGGAARPRLAFDAPHSMAAPTSLEARVRSILSTGTERKGVTAMDVLKIAVIGLMASTAMACARPSFAEDTPRPVQTTEVAAVPAPPPAPAAPPEVSALPDLPVPPVAPVAKVKVLSEWRSTDGHAHQKMMIVIDGTKEQLAALEKARPEIAKALAELKANKEALAALQKERPRIDAEVAEAMRKAGPDLQRAIALAHGKLADVKVKVLIVKSDHDRAAHDAAPDDPQQ